VSPDSGAAPALDPQTVAATAELAANLRDQRSPERRVALAESAGVAGRAALYQVALQSTFPELRALAAEAAALPESPGKAVALEALLARALEIDAAAAIELALDLDVDTALVGSLYGAWGRSDPEAALDALGGTENPRLASSIALALHAALGSNPRAAERVAQALPADARATFMLDALEHRARRNPQVAFRDALAHTDPASRTRALQSVAAVWAGQDPHAALAAVERLDDPGLRTVVTAAVLDEWAIAEPEAVLAYLANLEPIMQRGLGMGVWQRLASMQLERALELAERLPGEFRPMLEQIAVQGLAERDPLAAWEHVQRLPPGMQREQLLRSIAQSYGRRDPEAALVWVRSLQPPQPELTAMVYTGLAATDPARAFDAALALEAAPQRMQALQSIVMGAGFRGDAQALATADKLLGLSDTQERRNLIAAFSSSWAAANPQAALDWLLANARDVDHASFSQIAQRFGQSDPAGAAAYVDLVPSEARGQWIAGVAAGYARTDAQAALDWVARFRGDDAYTQAAAIVAQSIARYDPQSAVRLVGTIDPARPESRNVLTAVAAQWAQQDPAAAGAWALEFPSADLRSGALTAVAQTWSYSDPRAARDWTMSLPNGANRDAALFGVVGSLGAVQPLDSALLNAFSSDPARGVGIMRNLYQIAQRDPAEARRLVDTYIHEPEVRRNAEQMLASSARRQSFGQPNVVFDANGAVRTIMPIPGGPSIGISSAPVAPFMRERARN
jgi:hypothetical protein